MTNIDWAGVERGLGAYVATATSEDLARAAIIALFGEREIVRATRTAVGETDGALIAEAFLSLLRPRWAQRECVRIYRSRRTRGAERPHHALFIFKQIASRAGLPYVDSLLRAHDLDARRYAIAIFATAVTWSALPEDEVATWRTRLARDPSKRVRDTAQASLVETEISRACPRFGPEPSLPEGLRWRGMPPIVWDRLAETVLQEGGFSTDDAIDAITRLFGAAQLVRALRTALAERPGGKVASAVLAFLAPVIVREECMRIAETAKSPRERAAAVGRLRDVADWDTQCWAVARLDARRAVDRQAGAWLVVDRDPFVRKMARRMRDGMRLRPHVLYKRPRVDLGHVPTRRARGTLVVDWWRLDDELQVRRLMDGDDVRIAIEAILGEEVFESAARHALTEEPGSGLAREVVGLVRPRAARARLLEAAQRSSDHRIRRRAIATLAPQADASMLPVVRRLFAS